MNNDPIALTNGQVHNFQAQEAWRKYCLKNNIKDPWILIEQCQSKIDEYSKRDCPRELFDRYYELQTYKDKYIYDRDVWQGKYILKNFGYNAFSKFAQTHPFSKDALPKEWEQDVYPCDGAEGQCSFVCPVFYNCPYQQLAFKNLEKSIS